MELAEQLARLQDEFDKAFEESRVKITDDGEIPIRTSTFLAPRTPFNIYGGLKINFMEGTMPKAAQTSFLVFPNSGA
jgi:hypothetical protein